MFKVWMILHITAFQGEKAGRNKSSLTST